MSNSLPAYPSVKRDESVVDDYHGRKVADPYRALEDPDAPETREFCRAQNQTTQAFLARAGPRRDRFHRQLQLIYNYDKFGAPWRERRWFYFTHHRGLENQAVIMQTTSIDEISRVDVDRVPDTNIHIKNNPLPPSEARVFLDPNKMSTDGTASLGDLVWSNDGNYVAYGVQHSGSDWADIHIMHAETRETLPEVLNWAKFYSIAWTHDNKGFYYCRFPEPFSLRTAQSVELVAKRGAETDESRNQSIFYHVLNTSQDQDRLVYTDPDRPKNLYGLTTSVDGKYLFITVHEDCAPRELLWYVDLSVNLGKETNNIVKLIDTYEARFTYVSNEGPLVYFHTNYLATRYKLICIDLSKPERTSWRDIIPEHTDSVLTEVQAAHKSYVVIVYMRDVSDFIELRALATGDFIRSVELPGIGKASIWARLEYDFFTIFFTSFLYPGTILCCDVEALVHGPNDKGTDSSKKGTRVLREMRPPGFRPELYCTRQVFYKSKDGTSVPMFIIGPKEESEDAKHKRPCLLYGYGGFCVSLTPFYSIRIASWLQSLKGVYVVANIRGGSEYGDKWHDRGILGEKQNVFDDFQWAARALVSPEVNITVPEKLMIMGGSNGGLLVGACVNQAPELFGAAVAQVGVLDMFRFTKFTIGSAWVSDYGDPSNLEDFRHLEKYSPLHNTFSPAERGTSYPAILLTTGSHDDRVVPLHSLKFAATLQHRISSKKDAVVQGDRPVLLRVDVKAGHGRGKPTSKILEEMADVMAFAAITLHLSDDLMDEE